jgi:hypothetical protein
MQTQKATQPTSYLVVPQELPHPHKEKTAYTTKQMKN